MVAIERTQVAIVGAGPSGLVLGAFLSEHGIRSVILEKEVGQPTDPRGIYLAGDAVRIMRRMVSSDLEMNEFSQPSTTFNFHKTSLRNPAFLVLDQSTDSFHQLVSEGLFHFQPKLEMAIRKRIARLGLCELREGCTVTAIEEGNENIVIKYDKEGSGENTIYASYLVGADGKKGVVRKHFLEPLAGIVQKDGIVPYEGTWIAANFILTPPTPETHPQLPFWKQGYSPQQVLELFWPVDWHFCCPPGVKPTVSGGFGPAGSRLWRHEFAEPNYDPVNGKSDIELMWDEIIPMVTRDRDDNGKLFEGGAITFPRDCIEVLRCRPFRFAAKVVNKWFHNRTALIGDAAHVFPPFGGQGIACGFRDAHGLAWRLALMLQMDKCSADIRNEILTTWALERRQGVDDAITATMKNGVIVNEGETFTGSMFRVAMTALEKYVGLAPPISLVAQTEMKGYKPTEKGFLMPQLEGGAKVPQIWATSRNTGLIMSDYMLQHGASLMTLLVLCNDGEKDVSETLAQVKTAVKTSGIRPNILSDESIIFMHRSNKETLATGADGGKIFRPATKKELEGTNLRKGYDEKVYANRLGATTRFAIIRPDYFTFASARNAQELDVALQELARRVGC